MTDYWPDQEGRISDGFTMGFCYAEDVTMVANNWVKVGTSATAGRVGVAVTSLKGDCNLGMVLKTPVTIGDMVPVMTYGVAKAQCLSHGGVTGCHAGSFCCNSGAGYITETLFTTLLWMPITGTTAASSMLGLILQTGAANKDEVLVLLGKCS